ncbi:acyl--CoA ligase [Nocardioides sp. zg-ZUI104]|uniref:class I adenylate-forming enzyme family protein n=1 Tax=Nocardioides faecalis TaxID=2803858 RepID=UPI001BCC59FD|nr:class I adenylate-forming enzyme family protein [Nocardioides faecalis]MBS4751939.1 acyl--CoA ligase [Nocardioides faecalis]
MTPPSAGPQAVVADGVLRVPADLVADYQRAGWWGDESVAELVARRARETPDGVALVAGGLRWSWREYDAAADRVAEALGRLGRVRGDRVAVLMPDGAPIHAALVGCARAGLVAVGIGARAGEAEIQHLLRRTGAVAVLTGPRHGAQASTEVVASLRSQGWELSHLCIDGDRVEVVEAGGEGARPAGAGVPAPLRPWEVNMLNSTSGTTGLPKVVTQFDLRWLHFSDLAIEAGALSADDVVLAVVPTPFGFGLWTSHFVGARLGAATVVMPRFDADGLARLIEAERATVLCCVSTQFRMLLNSPEVERRDLGSLRVVFTGGEAVPYERALELERRTGATVLQFFGSNETGALSRTTLADDPVTRLRTSGRVLPHMQVRVVDEAGVVQQGEARGRPAGRGPLTCLGYWDDEDANRRLYTEDGWMLMGDVVARDAQERLTVVGRDSDIIIRGGKNISAPQVEALVDTHPAVALVGVVPVPDPLFGERVCAVVQPRPGVTLDLPELVAHLLAQGVSKELLPEHLVLVADMPRSSGAKLAKAEVRRIAAAAVAPDAPHIGAVAPGPPSAD